LVLGVFIVSKYSIVL